MSDKNIHPYANSPTNIKEFSFLCNNDKTVTEEKIEWDEDIATININE
jgi:hypothetical protein